MNIPISDNLVGSSETASSLERKLLMALNVWQETKQNTRKQNNDQKAKQTNKNNNLVTT